MLKPSRLIERDRRSWSSTLLESRLMLAADAGVAVTDAALVSSDSVACSQEGESAAVTSGLHSKSRIVFIDQSISDSDLLAKAVTDGAEIVLIDGADAIDQISRTLQGRSNVDQISLVSHGENGKIFLGEEAIDQSVLVERSVEIRAWRSALSPDADILVFGCNVAAGSNGQSMVHALASLTGADVAASVDRTGNLVEGADWELEFQLGTIAKNDVFCSGSIRRFHHTLDIVVHAWGQTGDEQIALLIDDQIVATYDLEQSHQALRHETNGVVTVDQVKVRFLNDQYSPALNYDRNVTVESIQIDGHFYETEDVSVRSTGTYRTEDGLRTGFGRGEMLHANGEFEFGTDVAQGGSRLEITARGQTGDERFALTVGNQVIGDFDVSYQDQTFIYESESTIQASDVQITFLNDQYDPLNPSSWDNNLIVDNIKIDGQVFETEAANVFSTGTWRSEDGVVSGFRQSEWLHTNGFFRYGSEPQGQTSLSPDSSFGDNGVIGFSEGSSFWVESLSDGFIRSDGQQLFRYDSNFQLDTSYGDGGVATIVSDQSLSVLEAKSLSDGTVIALTRNRLTLDNYQLHQISPTGQYLNSVVANDLGAGPLTQLGSGPQLETLADDTIVLAGGKDNSSVTVFFGLNKNLTLDSSFGNNGIIEHEGLANAFDSVIDIVATDDGGFFTFGRRLALDSPIGVSINRFTGNGQVVFSYGSNGVSEQIPLVGFVPGISHIKIDSQGRVVGYTSNEFVRWNTDGSLDDSFGNGGLAQVDLPPVDAGNGVTATLSVGQFGFDAQDNLVISQPVLQGNRFGLPTELGAVYGRLNSDGSSDTTLAAQFIAADTNQAVSGLSFGSLFANLFVDEQGRIVVFGSQYGSSSTIDPAIARYVLS